MDEMLCLCFTTQRESPESPPVMRSTVLMWYLVAPSMLLALMGALVLYRHGFMGV